MNGKVLKIISAMRLSLVIAFAQGSRPSLGDAPSLLFVLGVQPNKYRPSQLGANKGKESIVGNNYRMIVITILTFGLGAAIAPGHATAAAQIPYGYSNEVYLGGNYMRAASGPALHNTNFGGWNLSATHYVTPLLGVTADFQGDYGHAPISPSAQLANNPFVYQHLFFLGPQVRWHRSERFSSSLRILIGATDTVSNSDTGRIPPSAFGLYPSATTLALKPGGTFDLNLSRHVALRLAPGVLLERQGGSFQRDLNISTGFVFRIGKQD